MPVAFTEEEADYLNSLSAEEQDAVLDEFVAEFIESTGESINAQVFKAAFEAAEWDLAEALEVYDHFESQFDLNFDDLSSEPEAEPEPEVPAEIVQFAEDHPEAAADTRFQDMVRAGDGDLETAFDVYSRWNAAEAAAVERILPRQVSFDEAVDEAWNEGAFGNPGPGKAYTSERHSSDTGFERVLSDVMDAQGAHNAMQRSAEAVVRRSINE